MPKERFIFETDEDLFGPGEHDNRIDEHPEDWEAILRTINNIPQNTKNRLNRSIKQKTGKRAPLQNTIKNQTKKKNGTLDPHISKKIRKHGTNKINKATRKKNRNEQPEKSKNGEHWGRLEKNHRGPKGQYGGKG